LAGARFRTELQYTPNYRRFLQAGCPSVSQTLVHAFVSSHVDGCNAVLAGSLKASTDHLQRA